MGSYSRYSPYLFKMLMNRRNTMIRKRKIHAYSGFPDKEIRSYESAGKLMARKAAVEGIVLLKNEYAGIQRAG